MFEEIFAHKKFDLGKLAGFGFKAEKSGAYVYAVNISGGQFLLKVVVADDGKVTSRVFDNDTGDEYVLYRAENAVGAFVGKIRQECAKILQKIADECFFTQVFKENFARRIIAYIRQKHGDELEFLWQKLPEAAIVRRQDNRKWYAVFLVISAQKIGLAENKPVEVIGLRGAPEEIAVLIDNEKYFPGYHMNKKHWFIICLNGSVGFEETCRRIDDSYRLAKK